MGKNLTKGVSYAKHKGYYISYISERLSEPHNHEYFFIINPEIFLLENIQPIIEPMAFMELRSREKKRFSFVNILVIIFSQTPRFLNSLKFQNEQFLQNINRNLNHIYLKSSRLLLVSSDWQVHVVTVEA